MSAFQVSKTHIDVLVYARAFCSRGSHAARMAHHLSDDALGAVFVLENARSLNARYPGDQDAVGFDVTGYRYARPAVPPSVVAMIKAIHCYEYQACEHDGWEKSDAHAYCQAILNELTHRLPGYDAAPWGFEAKDVAAPARVSR